MKKGFLFSIDVLMAMSVLLLLTTFLVGISFTYSYPELRYQRVYLVGKDIMTVMEKLQVSDILEYQTVQESFNDSMLTEDDMNKTLLDIIGAFWASGNATYRDRIKNITEEIFNQTVPQKLNFEILIGGTSIYRRGDGDSSFLSRSSTIASGYEMGKPVSGYVARAWATKIKKNTTKVITFHPQGSGYRGADLQTWKYFTLNTTKIINATFYISFHYTDLDNLSVNGQDISGSINWLYQLNDGRWGSGRGGFGVVDVTDQVKSGNNTIYTELRYTANYHSHFHPGMRLEITYEAEEFETANETVKERYYFDHIIAGPRPFSIPRTGAWQMITFFIPKNATIKNVMLHLKAEDIEISGWDDCRVWFNYTEFSFTPPANETVDKLYNFTDMTGEGTNWVLVQLNYIPDSSFRGLDDTIIYSDPFNDPDGSSYVEVEYEREEDKQYYGYIDIGMSENAGGAVEDPKTFSIDFENETLMRTFLHMAQIFSYNVTVEAWPSGSPAVRMFQTPSNAERATPADLYIDPSYYDTSVLNYIRMTDEGNDFLPETSIEYSIWTPSMVGYGEVNQTEQGAIDDAVLRLNHTLGKYVVATSISTDVSSIAGIPTLWGPARVEVRVWI